MASTLVVLNNNNNNNNLNQQIPQTVSSANSSDMNKTNGDSNNNNENSLINIVGTRISSTTSPTSLGSSGSNDKHSSITIANSEVRTSFPAITTVLSPKFTEKPSPSNEEAHTNSGSTPKVYISTHHLKMSTQSSNRDNLVSSSLDSNCSLDKKVSIVNNTRENSAKIKIKYNYNNFNNMSMSSSSSFPLMNTSGQYYNPLESSDSLSTRQNTNQINSSPCSSSPSSPSSLASNPSETSNSPIPNLILTQSNLVNNDQPHVFFEDENTDLNVMMMEANKLHLSIVNSNISNQPPSFISDACSNTNLHSRNR